MTRDKQTKLEIERGQQIQARAYRLRCIEDWERERKIVVTYSDTESFLKYGDREVAVTVLTDNLLNRPNVNRTATFGEPAKVFPSEKMIADLYLLFEFDK